MPPKYSDREPPLTRAAPPRAAAEDDDDDYDDRRAPPRRSIWRLLVPLISIVVLAACGVAGYMLAAHLAETSTPAVGQAQAVTPETKPAPAATTSVTEPLSAEQPAKQVAANETPASAPAADPKFTTERFEGWFVVCPADTPNSPNCYMIQQLRSAQSKALVFVWRLTHDDKGVHALWQTPPGVDTSHGMLLDIGDGKPRQVPFANCDTRSCVVQGVLAPEYLKTLSASANITATIVIKADGKALRYSFSSKGMSDALKRLGAS